ncbi:caspase family protein [Burkholderia sp. PR2]|uniref:caspase family protein n=1 Tax=Burkholderia sp. PR2 TaxID=3448078 RepID=UPI00402A8F34
MRILLSIGCNEYDHATHLSGAEADARRMYDVLVRPDVGDYDETRSKLLLSPSVDAVRQALREILFSNGKVDTFTFFFAGHGGVRAGSFYMWIRDTQSDAQSITALSLSDVFRSINEAAPTQSNIIIDACESGGLIADLGVLLKADMLGDAGTPGITLVATSAQNQFSGETDLGGFGTNAILDCIEGRDFVQDTASVLDLVEIGRCVSNRLRETDQSPVVWGLNLYGPPRFCRNPRYGKDPAKPLREIVQSWPGNDMGAARERYDDLWRAYASVSDEWHPRSFADVVTRALSPLTSTPDLLAGFLERFGDAVLERAEYSDDVFRKAQVSATLAVCLLPHLQSELPERAITRFLETTGDKLIAAGSKLLDDLTSDRYALLAKRGGGLSELFYLPLRVAKVLGWTAASPGLYKIDDPRRTTADALFSELLQFLLEHYTGSIVTMSDAQAPYWAVALSRAAHLRLDEQADKLAGLLFNSIVNCRGRLARCDIPPESTLDYLLARRENEYSQFSDLIERPNKTLTVLMRIAPTLCLNDVFDHDLWKLDGVPLTAYINPIFSEYGQDMMSSGQNLVWSIGYDIFRVADLSRFWPRSALTPSTDTIAAATILASFLYPDRVPWFCLESLPTRDAGTNLRCDDEESDNGSPGRLSESRSPSVR